MASHITIRRRVIRVLIALLLSALVYLLFWPVPVQPVAWRAPSDEGYSGSFARNNRLSSLTITDLGGRFGPEDIAVGPDDLIYTATHDGDIIRIETDGLVSVFANTGGRPLGIEFAPDGNLYVADAYRGLLMIDRTGDVTLLTDQVDDGSSIRYADDVDIASDGRVFFSDASTRFGAQANGGTLAASVLDLLEHSSNGRVLVYDPATMRTQLFADGLTFANGVALSADESALMVVETGTYSVWRLPLDGSPGEVVIENLPGFPDNINPAPDGTFWVGLVSPRNPLMDRLASRPFFRRMVARLPESFRPAPTRYGLVFRIDDQGSVIETLQDPTGAYALTTGAVTHPDGRIVISSLTEPGLGILLPSVSE
ncbi:MAG: SMP-30/gluconolactonase/LRE family protein [Pseudomonadota bacterium]